MTNQEKKSVVILGGSVEAYMAAWAICRQYDREAIDITLLDTGGAEDGGALSLQEESLSILARFDLNEKTLLENVAATHKLGTRFVGWQEQDADVIQPIGTHGGPMDLVSFQSFAVKKRQVDGSIAYNDYALGASAAAAGKFAHPQTGPGSILATLGYSVHLDSTGLLRLLKERCVARGVSVRKTQAEDLAPELDRGYVSSIASGDRDLPAVDILIDCSNVPKNRFSEALSIPFESWRAFFGTDRKLPFSKGPEENCKPLTTIAACEGGFIRKSPLESSTAGGFYYASERLGEEEARSFLRRVEPDGEADSSVLEFETGIRESAWVGNYVALGKTYGRYEPLDSSNFHGFLVALERFLDLFPRTQDCELEAREFNRKTRLWYENLRDFNLMRTAALRFSDLEPGRTEGLPESFRHKLDLFVTTARPAYFEEEPFPEHYRVSSCINMGFWPRSCDPLVERFDFGKLDQRFEEMKRLIADSVSRMSNHLDYKHRLLASQ